MLASVLYKIVIGITKVRLEFFFEFCEKHVFANSSYSVHPIRTKYSKYHQYTKLVNPYQKLGKILFPSEAFTQ